jgi:hypothetical protein
MKRARYHKKDESYYIDILIKDAEGVEYGANRRASLFKTGSV